MPFPTVTITVVSLARATIPVNSQISQSKRCDTSSSFHGADRLNVKIDRQSLKTKRFKKLSPKMSSTQMFVRRSDERKRTIDKNMTTTTKNTRVVQPYLFFDGRCDEALEFYRQNLGAEVNML